MSNSVQQYIYLFVIDIVEHSLDFVRTPDSTLSTLVFIHLISYMNFIIYRYGSILTLLKISNDGDKSSGILDHRDYKTDKVIIRTI